MKADRKTKTARIPARSKTDNAPTNGKAAGKRPGRPAAPAITIEAQVPGAKKIRRRAQEELVGTRQQLMATYEHAPIGIVECSLEGRHVNVNQEFCRLTGYSREELLHLGIKDLTYEEDYIFDIKLHQRLVEGQIPFYKLEKRYVRKDGELIWVELTRNIMRDADGKGLFTIGAVVDVTERKRAEEALQLARYQAEQAADRIARLQEVTAALSEAVTPAQVAEIVVEQGGPALGAATGTVMLLLEDDETLEIVHTTSSETVTRPYQRFPISLNIPAADAARTGEPVWIESREQYLECYPHLADQIAAWGRQAALAIPMVDKGRTLGVLALSFEHRLAYSPEDREYVLTLARQGAQALERARLFEAEQQARRAVMEFAGRQEVLYRLADQLHHTQSLEDVFTAALDAIFSALRCDRASILLYDDTNVMRFVAWRGLSDGYRRATEGHSPWQPDVKNPEPIACDDVSAADFDDSLKAIISAEGIGSLAFIPLVSNGKLIGKFMVYFDRRHAFSEAELELSLTIARQLASAIDRKRADEALRRNEKMFSTLVDAAPFGVYFIDSEFRLRAINKGSEAVFSGIHPLIGRDFAEILRIVWEEPFATEVIERFRHTLRTGESFIPPLVVEKRANIEEIEAYDWQIHRITLSDGTFGVVCYFYDLSEQKRMEAAVRASEERYRTIVDTANEGIWYIDLNATTLFLNEPLARILGYPVEEITGRRMPEFCFPEDVPEAQARLANNYQGNYEHFDFRFRRKDGSEVLVLASTSPVRDAAGEIIGALGMFVDITDRKRAEEQLRASEERYRAVVESQAEMLCRFRRDGTILFVNGAYARARGSTPEELMDHNFWDFVPEEDRAGVDALLDSLTPETPEVNIENRFQTVDGERWMLWTNRALSFDAHGRVLETQASGIDITARKQTEEALRASEERYRNLFELVPVAVYTCDAEGLIQEYNHRAVELWGREPRKNDPSEKYCGSSRLYYPDGRHMPHEECPMSRVLAGENLEPHELEVLVERPDGVRRNIIAHPLPLRDEHREIVAAINCLYDITERKQAEQALQELNQQLENRVRNRTARLQAANQALREEIAEREQAEELLRRWAHIFEHADWGIATVYQDILTMVNPTYAKMHGYTVEELVGRNIYDIYAPDTHAEIQEQIRIAYERGHHIFESRQLRRDGSVFPVLVDTTVVRDEDGNVLYRAVNVQDITERKRVERELHESRARLQVLSRRLVEVQEDERRAIARELHDRVGQTLAALNINLIIMNSQFSEDSKQLVGSRMDDSLKLVAETIALVRNVMTDLRPAVLDDYGLEAALQSYIDDYKSRYGIQVFLNPSDTPIPRLDPGLEMTLLRIGQEALTNVARHAQAGQVRVSLRMVDHSISLVVQDDGVGMDSSQRASSPSSHGLKIMRERAEAFGGTITLESAPGKGTTVEARIPIQSGAQIKPSEEMHL